MPDELVVSVDAPSLGTRYVLQLQPARAPTLRPLVVVLDGDDHFAAMRKAYAELRVAGQVTEIDFVAVGYGATLRQKGNQRIRDYTPTQMAGEPEGGGAPMFLDWLADHCLPWLADQHGMGQGARGLAGHSLGGLFVLFACFQPQPRFDFGISVSPSIWYDDRWIVGQIDRALGAKPASRDLQLDLSIGAEDTPSMLGDFALLRAKLSADEIAQPRVNFGLLPGKNHYNVVPDGFKRGLMTLFPGGDPRLPQPVAPGEA